MTIKNVKLNSKEAELYTYIYSKYSKDLTKYGDNRRREILLNRLKHNSFVGGLTLLTVGYLAQMFGHHYRRRRINIDNELVAKLNADPEIQKMFELEETENVSAE